MKRMCSILSCLLILTITTNSFSTNISSHRKKQARPIRLGTSGGNVFDSTALFCCSGTLGALVTDISGTLFVLSNNHVLAKENKASIGDPISQPGLIDARCSPAAGRVATLSKFVQYRFGAGGRNKVDAAIGKVIEGQVSTDGKILEIGIPGQPVAPEIGMLVRKSGRTTGRTTGRITDIHVNLRIQIPEECGSDHVRIVRFVDQIIVEPAGTSRFFVKAGDSGSLIVEKKKTCPGAVALLFAGTDEGIAIANRIQNVLNKLKVFIVGCGTPVGGIVPQANIRREDPKITAAMAVQERHEEELLRIPGTLGVGIGIADPRTKEIGLVIYIEKGSTAAASSLAIPQRIENLPVRRVITSPFKAM